MRNHNVEKLEFIVIFRISALFWTFWAHCQYKCSSSSGVRVLTILMFICQQFWLEKYLHEQNFSPDGATIDSLEFGAGRKPICHPHEPQKQVDLALHITSFKRGHIFELYLHFKSRVRCISFQLGKSDGFICKHLHMSSHLEHKDKQFLYVQSYYYSIS